VSFPRDLWVAIPGLEVHAGRGAQVRYVGIQRFGDDVWDLGSQRYISEADSTIRSFNVLVGSHKTKLSIDSDIRGNGATVNADGSVRVSADESLKLDVIAGNLSGGGTAAVGAAVAVPIITKETHASIGDNAHVNAKGLSGVDVKTGGYTVTSIDTRFRQADVSGSTIDLNYDHNFTEGQEVLYDNGGGTSIGGLTDGHVYYVHVTGAQTVQLRDADGNPVTLAGGGTGESHRLVPTNQAGVRDDQSPRFDPTLDRSGDTIALPYTLKKNGSPVTLAEDDGVVYSSGGGDPIGGLVDGQTYYVHVVSPGHIQLRDKKSTDGGSIVSLTSDGSGRSHSIVVSGAQPSGDASAIGPRVITPGSTSGTSSGISRLTWTRSNAASAAPAAPARITRRPRSAADRP